MSENHVREQRDLALSAAPAEGPSVSEEQPVSENHVREHRDLALSAAPAEGPSVSEG